VIIKTQNRRPNNIQKTSPQSYKTQIQILPFPGLFGSEQPSPGATLLGWPKSIYYISFHGTVHLISEQVRCVRMQFDQTCVVRLIRLTSVVFDVMICVISMSMYAVRYIWVIDQV